MRRITLVAGFCVAFTALAVSPATALAQGPGGLPGAPMQRLGPSRGPATSMGTPGQPMARMGRATGGFSQSQSAPSRRNYGAMTGMAGTAMTSEQFRASNFVNQARSGGMMRSSSGVISGVTQGTISGPTNSR